MTESLFQLAPVVPEAIADDLIYAFAHGWIQLPMTTGSENQEAAERLTRLHSVRVFAETNWRTT